MYLKQRLYVILLLLTLLFGIVGYWAVSNVEAEIEKYSTGKDGNNITFFAHSTGHDFQGTTSDIEIKFGGDKDKIEATAFCDLSIPVCSLKTGINRRDINMYDAFEKDKFPEITFKLEKLQNVKWSGSDTFTAISEGILNIHGVSRRVKFNVLVRKIGTKVIVDGNTSLNMTDYKIEPPSFLFFKVADNVKISFHIIGHKTA